MKAWRRSRPFWGGLFTLLAGLELFSISFAVEALPVILRSGTMGMAIAIALVMIIVGVLLWLQPSQGVFLGLVAVVLSMVALVYTNLGGFLIGTALGSLGGALAAAWTASPPPAPHGMDAPTGEDQALATTLTAE
ncbi:DUF6114 domain-containing protein [Streptosporangium algeriense]|uniref:DUF6114 domain-containing protein n=1 Tax=Streptosporangium algeriense TaxID=1682748 RepID=A0ABW3DVZ6_9ACTN